MEPIMRKSTVLTALAAATFALFAPAVGQAAAVRRVPAQPPASVIHYRTAKIEGLDVFYREAGPKDAPTVLLLHGFPSSSFQYRNLIPALAARYHVIAPDYLSSGESSVPDRTRFAYTFAQGWHPSLLEAPRSFLGPTPLPPLATACARC